MAQAVNRERKTIRRAQSTVYLDGMTLAEAAARLNELVADYGSNAIISEHTEQYDEVERLHVMVDMPENDAQMASRIALEEQQVARQEECDRKEYDRLAAKFSGLL